jgi:hypothetical protein
VVFCNLTAEGPLRVGNALLGRPLYEISQETEGTMHRTSVGKLDDIAEMYRDVRITLCILKKYLLYESIWTASDNPWKMSLAASCK